MRCADSTSPFRRGAVIAVLTVLLHAGTAGAFSTSDSTSVTAPDSSHFVGTAAGAAPPAIASADSGRVLPTVVVHAMRPQPQEILARLPGHIAVIDMAPLRDRMMTAGEALERVPGVHVSDFGSLGAFSTVSIRGSGGGQVGVYLDGVPLTRAGLGVVNLSELPFASLDRIEVFRGYAPAELPNAGMGGAINLVTRGARPGGPAARDAAIVGGGGSFGTWRAGLSQEIVQSGWSGLLVADHLESDGAFTFLDDNGTPWKRTDDEVVARQNNWLRSSEVLARLGRVLPRGGELHLLNQWVHREQGVPGISSYQSDVARSGTQYDVTSLETRWPGFARGKIGLTARVFHEWRRDTFADPESDIGLGYQDNRDTSRGFGSHLTLRGRVPGAQQLTLDVEARRDRFEPWRALPELRDGPDQSRDQLEVGIEDRWTPHQRLALFAGLRARRRHDRFQGDLRTPYSRAAAPAATHDVLEPRAGARWAAGLGFVLRANYGEYERVPGFQELFGDGGSLAGSSDLVAETGIDRDIGIEWNGAPRGVHARLGMAHFDNDAAQLIVLLPQSQRTFVARNIGSARMTGQEWWWSVAGGQRLRWSLDGGLTHLDARDLGIDMRWYAGHVLPGRPALQLEQRASLGFGWVDLGYDYERLDQNYLDRANTDIVERRDLHGIDARLGRRHWSVRFELRNLTDERASDVRGFPLPGRTFFATTSFQR